MSTLIASPAAASDPLASHDGVQIKATFDTDSLDFGIDNRCSACISNVREHFVGDLERPTKSSRAMEAPEFTMSGREP